MVPSEETGLLATPLITPLPRGDKGGLRESMPPRAVATLNTYSLVGVAKQSCAAHKERRYSTERAIIAIKAKTAAATQIHFFRPAALASGMIHSPQYGQ